MKRGLFVLAHGSKAKEADDILKEIIAMLEERNKEEFPLLGFGSLQISKPSFHEGIDELVNKGAEEIVIVPMFLFQGNHIKYDIPEELDQVKEKYPAIKFIMAKHIGADRRVAEIVKERGKEALALTF
ncbi:sirohydrochlorin chelatase [Natronincola ferrireducens]|uniref:CbiX protein n=1 Tax=Natronincola ferrireducens TaxID=393762 RepID=A0A1G8WQN7_9FIRM|nr:CbiX/SirB N-terminal domain-containing protein [Natronincola ferrireducens]SDJ80396.1 CbiX protein [Natronincola ferrireducens]